MRRHLASGAVKIDKATKNTKTFLLLDGL